MAFAVASPTKSSRASSGSTRWPRSVLGTSGVCRDGGGDATNIRPFDDDRAIINPTVWESIEALTDFTYRSGHVEFLRRREFFETPTEPILCLWWIPEGTIPTVEEALERLAHLRAHGPTPTAFTFRHRFEPGEAGAAAANDRDTCPA